MRLHDPSYADARARETRVEAADERLARTLPAWEDEPPNVVERRSLWWRLASFALLMVILLTGLSGHGQLHLWTRPVDVLITAMAAVGGVVLRRWRRRRARLTRGRRLEPWTPATSVAAHDARGLCEILDAIHDLWFSLPDVRHDAAADRVAIPMTHAEERRGWFGIRWQTAGDVPAGTLTFEAVRDFWVVDEARIETYNVGSLRAQSPAGGGIHITLEGGIPIELHVIAERIDATFSPAPDGDVGGGS